MEQTPSKASILGALSQALDLVEGQIEGHALRTSLIAHRIGSELGLDSEELEDLFFGAVLKDSGCSNNSVRIHKIFGGDELISKKQVKFINWSSATESLKFAFTNTERGNSLAIKLRRIAENVGPPSAIMNEVTRARCTRGALIAQKLSFRSQVAQTILGLDEHWDGKGSPTGSKGSEIPVLARILCLAQTFDVFRSSYGLEAAREVIAKRTKRWFDPEISAAILSVGSEDQLWNELEGSDLNAMANSKLPWLEESAIDTDIDGICEAFAMIIDAKSSFTSEHSDRVTEYAVTLGKQFGFSEIRLKTLRRACLMHDIGKLGVSSAILEKPGRLDPDEFNRIKLHPKFSDLILRRIPTFDAIADIASAHHERLDGKGYWRGLSGEELSLDTRITTVCDVFDALTARRPYRDALPLDQVFKIMDQDRCTAFDPDCVEALKNSCNSGRLLAA